MLKVQFRLNRDDLNFDIQFNCVDQGVTTLFGASGAGKSSVLNVIAGLDQPRQGSVHFNDDCLFDNATQINLPPEKRGFGYVFQDSCLFPHMTVQQNLSYGSHHSRQENIGQASVTSHLGISHLLDRKPASLSGGEAQRVSIARALLSNPRMLLMDEPLASLDHARKKEILPLLKSIATDFKCPILYVSHSFDEVLQLSDQLVLIENGKTIGQGTPEELTTNPIFAGHLEGFDAGSILNTHLDRHDPEFGLSYLSFSGGTIPVPQINQDVGSRIRLRLRARDITLSNEIPQGISTLIRLSAKILSVDDIDKTHSYVRVQSGDAILLARITRKSIQLLGIQPNKPIFCLVKSVTLEL